MSKDNTRASLKLLFQISRELASSLDLQTIISRVISLSVSNVKAERGSLIVLNENLEPVDFALMYGDKFLPHIQAESRGLLDDGLAGWVAHHREAVIVSDTKQDERWFRREDDAADRSGSKSAICTPLLARGQLVGVLTIVHPAPGNWEHTLVNALLAYCPDLAGIGGKVRPGIVHRLDKNTSGLIMVAKNDGAHHSLSQQLKERLVKKRYLTLLVGQLAPRQGAVDAQLGRDPRNRKKMAVVSVGREALTRYQVISYLDGYTYVEAMPETGRTHQIRVHFAAIGFPVYADAVYGNKSDLLGRHFLHAHQLGFKLPSNNEDVEFKSDLPEELKIVLDQLSAEGVA